MTSISIYGRRAGSLAIVSAAIMALSACGGGVSGEFYNGDGLLVIDADSVVFTDFTCSESNDAAELDSDHQFKGELTDDGSQIMWDIENQSAYSWTPQPAEPIIENSSGEQITIGDQQFTKTSKEDALNQYLVDEC